jgi:Rieske Fe-S protein
VTPGVAESWVRQSWPVRVLRAFLGATFAYAGVQKFADQNFPHPGSLCHGAEFGPARNAVPVAGPATSPLRRIPVALDAATGQVLATS